MAVLRNSFDWIVQPSASGAATPPRMAPQCSVKPMRLRRMKPESGPNTAMPLMLRLPAPGSAKLAGPEPMMLSSTTTAVWFCGATASPITISASVSGSSPKPRIEK